MIRIGHGFDAHRFDHGRPLILGGVEIPADKGLLGHSDADVLTHAVMDALLGALALGDIGMWFPDNNPDYENASSLELLETILDNAKTAEWKLVNLDCVIIAQKPKLAPNIPEMRKNIADAFKTNIENVSIKATTTEKMGFCGREEGIAATAAILLEKQKP